MKIGREPDRLEQRDCTDEHETATDPSMNLKNNYKDLKIDS